jgi:glycosyltransferase involved in cell wall biosynthesis
MLDMGVDIKIFNLSENRDGFLENYSHIKVPYIFGKVKQLSEISENFDAVIASANYSVPWLKPLQTNQQNIQLGYYVQGFEALMYNEGSDDYQRALDSYTMIEGIKRFTKTQWTKNEVLKHTGADSEVVGISVNTNLFRPRDIIPLGSKPVTIVAMVRPGSLYRNPVMTLEILKQVAKKYKDNVDIWLFGADDTRDVVEEKYLDFKWRQMGKLTQIQVASMMSKADIFVDFSSHQAMGLAALEAMSAGCSVIVPKNGGAVEFITHKHNGIVADQSILQASLFALEELIENDELRKNIQINGIHDVVQYYPEKVSYNILATLFNS